MEAPEVENASATQASNSARKVFLFGSSPPSSAAACHRASSAPPTTSPRGVMPQRSHLAPFPSNHMAAPAYATSTLTGGAGGALSAPTTGEPIFHHRQAAHPPASSSFFGAAAAALPLNHSSDGLLLPPRYVAGGTGTAPSIFAAKRAASWPPSASSTVSREVEATAADFEGFASGGTRLSADGGRGTASYFGRTASLPNHRRQPRLQEQQQQRLDYRGTDRSQRQETSVEAPRRCTGGFDFVAQSPAPVAAGSFRHGGSAAAASAWSPYPSGRSGSGPSFSNVCAAAWAPAGNQGLSRTCGFAGMPWRAAQEGVGPRAMFVFGEASSNDRRWQQQQQQQDEAAEDLLRWEAPIASLPDGVSAGSRSGAPWEVALEVEGRSSAPDAAPASSPCLFDGEPMSATNGSAVNRRQSGEGPRGEGGGGERRGGPALRASPCGATVPPFSEKSCFLPSAPASTPGAAATAGSRGPRSSDGSDDVGMQPHPEESAKGDDPNAPGAPTRKVDTAPTAASQGAIASDAAANSSAEAAIPEWDRPEHTDVVMEYMLNVAAVQREVEQPRQQAAVGGESADKKAAAAAVVAKKKQSAGKETSPSPEGVTNCAGCGSSVDIAQGGGLTVTQAESHLRGGAPQPSATVLVGPAGSARVLHETHLNNPGGKESGSCEVVRTDEGDGRIGVQDRRRTARCDRVLGQTAGEDGGEDPTRALRSTEREANAAATTATTTTAATTTTTTKEPAAPERMVVGAAAGGELSAAAADEASLQRAARPVDLSDEGADPPPVNLLDERNVVVLLDLETTGLFLHKDRVIQLAAKVMGGRSQNHVFSAFVDPEGACLHPEVQKLTGITPQRLARNNARPFREVWPRFASWLRAVAAERGGGGRIVFAAHNARFDRNFLAKEVVRAGLDSSTIARLGVLVYVDTLTVLKDGAIWKQTGDENHHGDNLGEDVSTAADSLPPSRPQGFKLGLLFRHIFEREMPKAHDARGDVEGMEAILSSRGVAERWRRVASSPECQIPVVAPPNVLNANVNGGGVPRVKKKQTRKATTGGSGGAAGAAPEKEASTGVGAVGTQARGAGGAEEAKRKREVSEARRRAREWAREQQREKTLRRQRAAADCS